MPQESPELPTLPRQRPGSGSDGDRGPEPGTARQDLADSDLVARLRAGDEAAFAGIVTSWSPAMLAVARLHVSTTASAQELVQEAWLAVIKGLPQFEGRSSLRTWAFRILTNLAKTRGVRESRVVPMSSLAPDQEGPTVDPNRFRGLDDQWPHNWTPVGAPKPWEPSPESAALATETRAFVFSALEELPDRQKAVVALRDVHGMSADEVCSALGLSAANQRVLLHRGRAKLRERLESYYQGARTAVTS